ncbi:DUF2157 domain-containing protein [Shewanella sp. 30m-9]
MNNFKSALWRWFEQALITQESMPKALSLACQTPTRGQWQALTNVLLTWLSGLFLGAGVVFFVAANWQSMGKLARFAVVEGALIVTLLIYLVQHLRARKRGAGLGFGYTAANAVLLAAAIIIGSLLALVGQTYQTGADPWQLFALWALFVLPLAWVAGSELLWLLLGLLVNLTLVLYYQTFPGMIAHLFIFNLSLKALFLLNLLLHFCCLLLSGKLGLFNQSSLCEQHLQHNQSLGYEPNRYDAPVFQQLSILISVVCITALAIETLFDWGNGLWFFGYVAFIGAGYVLYNFVLKDIFVLAIGSFSLVAVVNSLLARLVLEGNDPIGLFLVLGLSIIGSTTAVTLWLKQRHQAFSVEGLS